MSTLSETMARSTHRDGVYSTAVRTGMRAGELAGLEWADVNFEQRLITVQRSFEGLTKSGEVRLIPILDVLLPELRAWRLRHLYEVVEVRRAPSSLPTFFRRTNSQGDHHAAVPTMASTALHANA